ncbi:MAG: hypothetical protein M1504_04020 [Candidatus Marsarchaeota archaeon]|nr:hypothetical protein [Candidatus Marsarchaeota archaeon]
MGIFSNLFGKKNVAAELTKNSPFIVSTEWIPYKLYAKKKSSSTLYVKIRNITKEPLLTSVVAQLPSQLGFEGIGLSKEREVRVGELAPNEEKEVKMEVFSGLNSDAGEYTLSLTAMAHYRDYGHILNAVKKKVTVDVV